MIRYNYKGVTTTFVCFCSPFLFSWLFLPKCNIMHLLKWHYSVLRSCLLFVKILLEVNPLENFDRFPRIVSAAPVRSRLAYSISSLVPLRKILNSTGI